MKHGWPQRSHNDDGTMEKVMAARHQEQAARSTRLAHGQGQPLSSTNLAQTDFSPVSDSLQVVE